ncbi:MAG: BrnT family toxin [Bryobacteraceae bacterium]
MVRFEWDHDKDATNRRKHRLGFETAKLVFDDPNCLTFVERVADGEERWHAIGEIGGSLIVTVVHIYRLERADEVVRIISARRADPQERRLYVETL